MLNSKLSPTALHLVIALCVLCTIGLFAIEIFYGDSTSRKRASANTFSYSAIGHHGLVELLRSMGETVRINQRDLATVSEYDSLIVAEPHLSLMGDRVVEAMKTSNKMLFVLPKWVGTQSLDNSDTVAGVTLVSRKYLLEILDKLAPGFVLTRTEGDSSAWRLNDFDIQPTISDAQLLRHIDATPLISSESGSLLMSLKVGDKTILILSDPDLINNHGLAKGRNAELAADLVSRVGTFTKRPVVIDETLHGFRLEPNFWRAMLAMPFIVATLAAFVTVIALVWSASNRFGAPFRSADSIAAGKRRLIENSVRLISRGRHGREIVNRYFHNVVRQVEDKLHVPDHLTGPERVTHLDKIAAARGMDITLASLWDEKDHLQKSITTSDRNALRLAKMVSRWKQGMLYDA